MKLMPLLCCYLMIHLANSTTVIETIMANYDKGNAPSPNSVTTVDHRVSITTFSKVKEVDLGFEAIIIEESSWTDSRLAYENNNSVDAKYKSTFLNLKSVISDVWIPRTEITNIVDHTYKDEGLLLYPNGTLEYTAYRFVFAMCKMDFSKIPFDENDCSLHFYSEHDDINTVHLVINQDSSVSTNVSFLSNLSS